MMFLIHARAHSARAASSETRSARLFTASALIVAILVASGEGPAAAPATASPPTPVDLGALGGTFAFAREINESGMVIGSYSSQAGDIAKPAFVWTQSTGMVDLTFGGNTSVASALHDRRAV